MARRRLILPWSPASVSRVVFTWMVTTEGTARPSRASNAGFQRGRHRPARFGAACQSIPEDRAMIVAALVDPLIVGPPRGFQPVYTVLIHNGADGMPRGAGIPTRFWD